MPFPLSRRAEIACKPASNAALVMGGISERLRDAGCENVRVVGDRIYFAGPKWKKRQGHLGMITEGEVKISTKGGRLVVSYSLRFKGLLMLTAAFAMLGLWMLNPWGVAPPFLSPLFWVPVSWLLGQVGSYIQTTVDFSRLMKRALKGD